MDRLRAVWHNEAIFLLAVGLFALALRLGYNLLYVGPGYVPELDAREYSDIAANLAAGQGYRLADGQPTAIRPPLFPLVLAAAYWLRGGPDDRAGLALQAGIGAGIVLAVYYLGKRVLGVGAGRAAALIASIYPLLIFAGSALLSEPLFVLLVTLAMLYGVRALDRSAWSDQLALGGLLGLVWLARPNGLLLVPFLVGWLLIAGRGSWGRRMVGAGIVVAATLVVVTPWVARNYLVFRTFIPSSTMGGAVLFGSYNDLVLNNPDLRGDWVSPCTVPGAGWTCGLDELGRDAAWRQLGSQFIRGHLADLPRMVWWRFVNFWHLYPFTHGFPANVGFYIYVATVLLAGAGTWLTRRSWRRTGVLLATIVCFMASALAFWGGFRMRLPAEPALIVLAGGALAGTDAFLSTFLSKGSQCK